MRLHDIYNLLNTQEKCIEFLEKKRWKDGVVCPYCGSTVTHKHVRGGHQCNKCHKSFSVTVGTIFHNTHVPLQKWFLLIRLMINAKKGISAYQASRDIDLRRTTVWSMMHRIRKAFAQHNTELFAGIVEMDETYIKTDEDKDDDKPTKRGRGAKKTAIVGLKEKDGGVKAEVVDNVSAFTLLNVARKSVASGCEIHTDEFRSYSRFKRFFNHQTVNHAREFVSATNITTNGIEGFWSLLKRGIQGNFHHVSKFYLQRYVDEFCYRYNNGKNEFVFDDVVERMLLI